MRTTWTYDSAYQLTRQQQSGSPSVDTTFTYDPAGNRHTKNDAGSITSYAYDLANRLATAQSAAGLTTFSYDPAGNRTRQQSPAATIDYHWDGQNRLTSVDLAAGSVTYTYNALGQRVARRTGVTLNQYVFDFDRILQQLDGAGDTQRLSVVTNERYGRLISEQTPAGSEFHLFDPIGSTRKLADDTGSVTDTYRYRAFGSPLLHAGSSDSPYTFVGRWGYNYDSDTGLYLARSRWLDPATGTWLSSDPLDILLGDPNRYRYALNNPIGLIDPSGEIAFLPILAFVGKSALAGTVSGGLACFRGASSDNGAFAGAPVPVSRRSGTT